MNGKNLFLAGLIGGVVIAALSNIPYIRVANCLFCMWVWVGGIFAAWLYKRFDGKLTPGQGAGVGALAGIIAGLIGLVISLFGFASAQAALSAASQYLDPELIGGFDLASLAGPLAVAGGFVSLILFTIFGTLGGLIGGAIFKSKPEAVAAYTPPPVAVPPAYVPPSTPVVEQPAYMPPPAPEVEPEVIDIEKTLSEPMPEEPTSPPVEPDEPAA